MFSTYQVPARYPVYPPHHRGLYLEEYFHRFHRSHEAEFPARYIPVYWTAYYVNPSYGHPAPGGLQEALDALDPSQRYFTVIQYDGGIRHRLPPRTTVFSAGGRDGRGIPIPLLCSPHENPGRPKDIFCSFVGSLTHPCRRALRRVLPRNGRYRIHTTNWRACISAVSAAEFYDVLTRSVFTLCPRGHGPTSFRLYEAMQVGSVPVYIFDTPWLPYVSEIDWDELCVMVPAARLPELAAILESKTEEEIAAYRAAAARLQDDYFTMEGTCRKILESLRAHHGDSIPFAKGRQP